MVYYKQIQQWLKNENLESYLFTRGDRFLGEYVAPCDDYLNFATGFSGSAGSAIITQSQVLLFIDGRYTVQAAKECASDDITIFGPNDPSMMAWLSKNPPKILGVDAQTISHSMIENFIAQKIAIKNIANPLDNLVENRPARPCEPVFEHPIEYAGASVEAKLAQICADINHAGADSFLIAMNDSLCWLLNIRGSDVPYNPVVHAYGLVHQNGNIDIFIEKKSRFAPIRSMVRLHEFDEWREFVHNYAQNGTKIGFDKARTPHILIDEYINHGGKPIFMTDPITMPKACKNETEQQGARNAHIRDGVAMVKFLCWFKQNYQPNCLSELILSDKLLEFRSQSNLFMGASFTTIASAGANGAINHYRPTPETNLYLQDDHVFLLDSGGQYWDGTTDITRTIFMPNAYREDRKIAYTAVLQGHIALSMAKFPKGISGHQLDSIARKPLWAVGLDFQHGTGHGVGSFMNVHEGPQRISPAFNDVAMRVGMITSNEPGYYVANDYGIRIENLILCVAQNNDGSVLGFEDLTYTPIDTSPIVLNMLNDAEINWLNNYHRRCFEKLSPFLNNDEVAWLKHATQAI